MKKWSYLGGAAASVLAAVALTPPAIAQQTTSDIRGQVTDASGAALAGASVTVVDSRTNQSRSFTTNANGQFSTRSLPVGGPYIVTATADGFQGQTNDAVFVSVSGATRLNFALSSGDQVATLDTIVVSGARTQLQPLAIGPGSSFGLAELRTLPSINRDLRDTISLDPRVIIDETNDDNISCLGGNNRSNAFTVDGVRQNDSFGLNASGFPSRNASPIPFDSIQEVSVEFAPFDVEYGQFTGCAINVVTLAGTNEFHGSGVFVYSNDSLFGDSIAGDDLGPQDFENLNWSAQLSGPIIKDRLFFAVTYEEFRDTNFVNTGPEELGFLNGIDSTLDQVQQVQTIVENQFGFPSGGIPTTVDEDNTRVLARLDWLVTDRHRAEFTYSYIDEAFIEPDTGGFQDVDFTFFNSFETSGTRADSYSLRFFSDWTDNFSTEVRISRNDIRDIQNPVGGGEAQDENPIPRLFVNPFELDAAGNQVPALFSADGELINCDNELNGFCLTEDGILAAGPGTFRSANALEQEIDQIKLKAEYLAGNHTLTAGYELDSLDVFNLFIPEATGTIQFESIDNFAAGQASTITATGSFSGDPNDAAANFLRNIHSVYVQDKWQVTPELTVLLGLRYDWYDSDDNPTASQAFEDRYGFSNTTGFNSLDAVLPRLGVTYESPLNFFGQTTFTGGVGIFAGADPSVFFSNAFTNFGGSTGFGGSFGGDCTPTDLIINPANASIPACIIAQQQAQAALGQGRTDAIDPNLELPTAVRYNIGFNHITDFGGAAGGFFDDWSIGVDYIHTINRNTLDFVDLTLTPIGTATDGRPIFNAVDPLNNLCDAVFLGPRAGFSAPLEQLLEEDTDADGNTIETTPLGACDSGGDDQDILLTNAVGGEGNSDVFSIQASRRWEYEVPRLGDGAFNLNVGYAYTDVTNVNPNTSSTATSNFEEVATATLNNSQVATASSFSENTVTVSARLEQEFFSDLISAITLRYRGRSGQNFSFAFDSGGNDFGDSDNEDRNLLFIPEIGDPNVVFATPEDEAGFNTFIAEQGLEDLRGSIIGRNTQQDPFFNDLDIRLEQELPTFLNKYLPDARALFFVDIDNFLNLINDDRNVFEEFDRGDVLEAVPVIDVTVNDDGTFTLFDFDEDLLLANGGGLDTNVNGSIWQVQFGFRFEF
ncbi:MAG: TonB-dependent receptor [Pseudomonadota bacterium]